MGNIDFRSMFCVFDNPQDHDPSLANLEPQEICDVILSRWTQSKSGRTGAVLYCISEKGLHHLHMVLECPSTQTFTFAAVKKLFPSAHLSWTRGTKDQVEAYINKTGKFEEKGEIILCMSQEGEIKGNQGKRSDLQRIQSLIESGATPSEIIGHSVKMQRFSQHIHAAYMAKRVEDTPTFRDVKVYWHTGKSGSGKSYTCERLIKEHGRQNVFRITGNLQKGKFDNYIGQRILFIDELDPVTTNFKDLLVVMDNYTTEISARYRNTYALWDELHITSIYTPEQFYRECVPFDQQRNEPIEQLTRRITDVVDHWIEDGEYRWSADPLVNPERALKEDLPFR